ncbi:MULTISPECIES: threonine/serine exporter family protein [Mammaliicoccus]|uniref:Threonine/serine exporter family protein n=1 Tax=Mammaliicoccus fleurettii TaxID=150056 RepID=A0ABS5MMG3_9STAP|nr:MULTISPECIES: threonine/serine exporter family protein [Mammaliicoccus]HCN60265.1 threonine/serine exporter [Staphylococcus sp.]MBL0846951.1 threonine/serine exporter family protein [Mammaliicoccus fleurettii]MBO3063295.1 threonine/serine exporter family protein [Mammaliicoccus fleurettii]MBS3671675.1 threonine/serine exporter family protein [Mammaliicoccus fleurettii]MBS3696827.1 threonine/serine exporter family protein [Mammaliicoccus fleurettii]
MLDYIYQILLSFTATLFFSVIFNAPKRLLIACGIVGAMGWMIYTISLDFGIDKVQASFYGSFALALMSHIMSRYYKRPMIIFIVAGIIPLVPGGLAYDATKNLVINNYDVAINTTLQATLISGAIAFGILCSEIIFQIYVRSKHSFASRKQKSV